MLGDIHFDDAESWTLKLRPNDDSQPIDLVSVAAHEIGHALGLPHLNNQDALMYTYYLKSHRFLHVDDIKAIRVLYGSKTLKGLSDISDVCYSSSKTIRYSPLCGEVGVSVSRWSTSLNIYVESSDNTTITIRAKHPSANGKGWVTSYLSNGVTLQEYFNVGVPSSGNLNITTPGRGVFIFSKKWQALYASGGDNFEWKVKGSSTLIRNNGSNSILIYPQRANNGQIITVGVRSKSACG